jgi:hypothetical protein
MMQDRNGQDSDYQVPGTWYLAPMPNSHCHSPLATCLTPGVDAEPRGLIHRKTRPSGMPHIQCSGRCRR